MWLENLIIKKAEKRLALDRKNANIEKERNISEYQKYLPFIKELYSDTTHWHGTGRYHYQHQEGSRYGEVHDSKILDLLGSIIESNGLKPHLDHWINSGGKTVSLATTRMHARVFACIHACDKDILIYELGSVKFWHRLYFTLLLLWLVTNLKSHIFFIRSLFRRTFFKDIQNWASAIKKPVGGKVASIFDIFKGEIPLSDINGNYPILFGVRCDEKELIDTIPLTHKVEKRSLKPINLKSFTHLEVALSKVLKTENILKTKGISLPVIPIEFCDIYISDQPLKELAFS